MPRAGCKWLAIMIAILIVVLVEDLVILELGEIVLCNGIRVQGHNMQCNATDETDAIKKIPYEACKDSESDKEDCFLISGSKVLEGTGAYILIAIGSKSSYGRIRMALQGDTENTPLQTKLNALAGLIAKLGSAAGGFLFTVLMIKFVTQLGRNTGRTRPEEASNFVDILIIAITLIVVALPEGLPLGATLAVVVATRRITLVHVFSPCDTMANATAICTDRTSILSQNLTTVVAGPVSIGEFIRRLQNNKTRRKANDTGNKRVKQDANQNLESDGRKSNVPSIFVTESALAERGHKDSFTPDQSKLGSFYCSAHEAANVGTKEILTKLCSTHRVVTRPGVTPFQGDHVCLHIDELACDNMPWRASANQSFKTAGWEDYRSARELADMVLNKRKTIDAAREAPNTSSSFPSAIPTSCPRAVATARPDEIYRIALVPSPRVHCNKRAPTRINTRRLDLSRLCRHEPTLPTSAPSVARPDNLSRPLTALPVAADSVEPAGSSSEPSSEPAGTVALTVRQRAAATLSMGNHWSAASALPACAARSPGRLSPKHLVVRLFTRTRTSRAWKGRHAFIPPSLHVPAASNNITRVPVVRNAFQRALSDVVQRSVLALTLVSLLIPLRVISQPRRIQPGPLRFLRSARVDSQVALPATRQF